MQRRRFLQGMLAGGGLLATGAGWSKGSGGPNLEAGRSARPALWLQTGAAYEGLFAEGLSQGYPGALASVALGPAEQRSAVRLQRLLQAHRGQRLLGLMEEVPFLLLQEQIRSCGARLLCVGQHSWGGASEYHSQHQFITTARAQGVGTLLAEVLAERDETFTVDQLHLGAAVTGLESPMPVAGRDGEWPQLLGNTLAQIGAGRWPPRRVASFDQPGQHRSDQSAGSLVSFLLEV